MTVSSRVAHGLDARGVYCLHLFDEGENAIQFDPGGVDFGVGKSDPREAGEVPDLFIGQRHEVTKPAESTKICRLS